MFSMYMNSYAVLRHGICPRQSIFNKTNYTDMRNKGYLKILFNWSSTSLPGKSGRPAFASSRCKQEKNKTRSQSKANNVHISLSSISYLQICIQRTTCLLRLSRVWHQTAHLVVCTTMSPPKTNRTEIL